MAPDSVAQPPSGAGRNSYGAACRPPLCGAKWEYGVSLRLTELFGLPGIGVVEPFVESLTVVSCNRGGVVLIVLYRCSRWGAWK